MLTSILMKIRQYPLRSFLLALLTLFGCITGWSNQNKQRQEAIIAKLEERGVIHTQVIIPDWLKTIGLDKYLSPERFRELTSVVVRSDSELKELTSYCDLSYLDILGLYGNKITARGLAHLDGSEMSGTLIINEVNLSKEDQHQIPLLNNVTGISIQNSKIDKEILEEFAKWPQLNFLTLSSVDISKDWLAVFEKMPQLRNILIENCPHVTDDGIRYLKSLTHLESIQLTNVPVSIRCLESFEGSLSLKTIYIWGKSTQPVTAQDLEILRTLPVLEEFGVDMPIDEKGIQLIAELENLTSVGFSKMTLTTDEFTTICALPKLSRLTFFGNRMTARDVKVVNEMTNELDLCLCSIPDLDSDFRELQKLTTPFSIYLEKRKLSRGQMQILGELSLKSLSLKSCQLPSGTLGNLTSITNLVLDEVTISPEDLQELVEGQSYSILSLRKTSLTDEVIPILSKLKGGVRLILSDNELTSAGKKKLKAAIPNANIWYGGF